MQPRSSKPRTLRALSMLLLCSLWPAAGAASPERPRLNQLPAASLTSLTALSEPEQVQRTSADLPFSIEIPEERKRREEALKKGKRKEASNSYATYEHRLTLVAKTDDLCLSSQHASSSRLENQDRLGLQRYEGYRPRVQAVRAERLLGGKRPRLVVEDFFVDIETDHVRRAAKVEVPLQRVAGDSEGFAIYAFREHHRINLVLSAPGASMVGPNTNAARLGCGMRRVSLPNDARNGVALSFALALPRTDHPERVENFQAYQQVPMKKAVRVSVSLSQTSRDPHPVLSVTLGTPNRPIQNALKSSLPRWNEVLGNEQAQKLQEEQRQKLSRL